MTQTRILMGMPITVAIDEEGATADAIDKVFAYFAYVDRKFSTYKPNSEISRYNRREIDEPDFSPDMRTVFRLSQETKTLSGGYFDIRTRSGKTDPSGLVKGWAIQQAALILEAGGVRRFFIEAGGDIQVQTGQGRRWRVGIRNPFNRKEIVKAVEIADQGVATSGTYIRGRHIYNPLSGNRVDEIVSLTVIGPNIFEADRFATAAFAMGKQGIEFIESLKGLEGYQIDKNGRAKETSGFGQYVIGPETHA